jgi:hypothetical protein
LSVTKAQALTNTLAYYRICTLQICTVFIIETPEKLDQAVNPLENDIPDFAILLMKYL